MPGPISESYKGPRDGSPYVPSHCYEHGPKMCPCGHHEGYHNDAGACVRRHECKCAGIPPECVTPFGTPSTESERHNHQ